MRASKADRPHLFISISESQAIRDTINEAIGAIADFAIVAAVVHKGHLDIQIDPARQRYAMLCEIDGFLGRIEISRLLYIQFVGVEVKPGRGASRGAM
jgi:hypothetical protein